MNLFNHITGYTLIAVLLMSVWLVEGPITLTVNIGDKVLFGIPANCTNGYILMNNNRQKFATISKLGINIYNSQLSKSDCSNEKGTPICFTYSVESDRDFGSYYLVNSNTDTLCPISYLINEPDDDDYMEGSTTITDYMEESTTITDYMEESTTITDYMEESTTITTNVPTTISTNVPTTITTNVPTTITTNVPTTITTQNPTTITTNVPTTITTNVPTTITTNVPTTITTNVPTTITTNIPTTITTNVPTTITDYMEESTTITDYMEESTTITDYMEESTTITTNVPTTISTNVPTTITTNVPTTITTNVPTTITTKNPTTITTNVPTTITTNVPTTITTNIPTTITTNVPTTITDYMEESTTITDYMEESTTITDYMEESTTITTNVPTTISTNVPTTITTNVPTTITTNVPTTITTKNPTTITTNVPTTITTNVPTTITTNFPTTITTNVPTTITTNIPTTITTNVPTTITDYMEESTTITTNTPTTENTTSSRRTPTFLSTNALTTISTISTSGTTAVQTNIFVDILKELKSGNTTAIKVLKVLANRTKTATHMQNDLQQIESVLEEITNNVTLEVSDLQTVTTDFMKVASNLINTNKAHLWREKLKMNNSGAESVIKFVDIMVSKVLNVASNESINLNFSSPELYVEVVTAVECQENITFPNLEEVNKESNFAQTMCPEGVNTTSYSGVIYYDIEDLIKLPTERGNMSKLVDVSNRKKVQKTIISFTNPGFDGRVLINIKLDNQKHKDPECVFLDIRENMWSDEGCKLVSYDSNAVRCECNHLTNFAVLMSVIDVSVHENTVLNLLSIVSCCISMMCLLVTMVIHIVYKRKLSTTNSSKVLLLTVLCGVLIFTYILFLAGITRTDNKVVCTAIAVILHLSLLTVFSLMLAIGIDYMLIVVKPLYTKKQQLGNLMILASFVCPAVIVGISAAATRLNGYGNDKACWLSMENLAKLAFIIPVGLVVCVNIGIMLVLFKAMFNTSTMKKKSGEEKIRYAIRSIFSLSPVFGFTWIIGIFAVNKETIAFQYIFVILNGVQGVLIMVCHCFLNPKVRGIVRSRTYRRRLLLESSNQTKNSTVSTQKSELQSTTAI